jgi:methyl-accepting chemotaxis protein
MGKNKRSIKNFIIIKDFQFKILLYNFFYLLLGCIATSIIILVPDILSMAMNSNPEAQFIAAESFIALTSRLLPGMCFIIILSCIHMTIITHRVCGPVIHITNVIASFRKGNFDSQIVLRKNDYIKNTAKELNALGEKLSGFVSATRTDLGQMDVLLEKPEDIDKIKEKIGKIKENFSLLSNPDNLQNN